MIDRLSKSPAALAALTLVAALIGAGAFWLFERAMPSAVGATDQARIERVVHDYVLAHPEILPEAMQKLREREVADQQVQARKVVAANRGAILKPFAGAWAGNPQGDVTIVEYFDYNCGYCRAGLPVVAQLLASDPKVKLVYREYPVLSEESGVAAKLSLAAADQGKFAAFHDALYAGGQLSKESMMAAARTAGLDLNKAAALAPRAEKEIAANLALGREMGLTGTPSWVIGDKVVSTLLSLEQMQQAVAEARAKG